MWDAPMIQRAAPRVATAVAASLICLIAGAVRGEVPSPKTDPFVAAMAEFWPRIRLKCPPPASGYNIAIVGLDPASGSFTDGQKDLVAAKIGAATSWVTSADTGVRIAPLREIGDAVTLMSAGHSRIEVDAFIRELQRQRNIGIMADGWATSQGYEFVLKTIGGIGLGCAERSTTIRIPAEALPEEVMQPDQFLSRAAEHIVQRLEGGTSTTVLVRSTLDTGAAAPAAWSQGIARAFRQGETLAVNRLATRSLNPVRVDIQATQHLVEAQAWSAEVVVGERSRATARLAVEIRPPAEANTDGLAFGGLVRADILPPLAEEDLRSASQTGALRGLDLSQGPQSVRFSLGGTDRRRELVFVLPASSAVEADLPSIEGPAVPNLHLVDRTGRDVAALVAKAASRPNLRRWRLPAGTYSMVVDVPKGDAVSFVLRVRASQGALAVEPLGQIAGEAGDWIYGVRDDSRGRGCFALTSGAVAPSDGGRLMSPYMLVQIRAGEEPSLRLDGAGEWAIPRDVVAQVERRGRPERLDLSLAGPPEGQSIVLDQPCRQSSGSCLPAETLDRVAHGTRVVLWGRSTNGTGTSVVYSLRGYRAAVYSMARLCGRSDVADALILEAP